ncbi:hypothetical protein [uncultured Methylobacterium sp.]|jgi:phage gp37-like protein|uniref:hypothetical protein n=1 Tax=uncultured Methylobacterium sp. TaxID=157278 RepID=UPI002626559A|nr:hypothetical protein [uncultured Methylobacterium sp.]
MSLIAGLRQRIVDAIRDEIDDLYNVDWYDGLFDEEDVTEWGQSAPAAYVAVLKAPTDPHATGEMLADLQIVVVVVTQDVSQAREGDGQNWGFMERIAALAKDNAFGDPNAAPAANVDFKKMRHPHLRREGVHIGVVEWRSNLTIGTNKSVAEDAILGLAQPPMLPTLVARTGSDVMRFEDPS